MIHHLRCASVVACLLPLAVACSSGEPTGRHQFPIWNGTGVPVQPGGVGIVHTIVGNVGTGGYGNVFQNGSGVALNNRWVLTAAHVRQQAHVGTASSDLRSIHADFGGGSTLYAARFATGVMPAPMSGSADPKYDLDLYRFDPLPIGGLTSGYKIGIFTGTTDQIAALDSMLCYGYGVSSGGSNNGLGILRVAQLDPIDDTITQTQPPNLTFKSPINFFARPNASGQIIADGDSGGPCFQSTATGLGNLLGVIRAKTPANPPGKIVNPAKEAIMTSVHAYHDLGGGLLQELERLRDSDPEYAYFGDVDGDGDPDMAMILADANGNLDIQAQLTGVSTSILPDGFIDFASYNLLNVQIPQSAIADAVAALGDFNGDGTQDILGFAGDVPLYYDGWASAPPEIHADLSLDCLNNGNCLAFTPLQNSYPALRVADVNGDGYDDVDALTQYYGWVDTYYGSPHGLTTGFEMDGFPTADGTDGKFLTLAVQPTASLGVPSDVFEIQMQDTPGVAAGEGPLHVEIFDGDLSGSHDTVVVGGQTTHTCYLLYADPDQDGSGLANAPLVVKDDSAFTNNAWGPLVDGKELDAAHVAGSTSSSGNIYSYLLKTFISTSSCTQARTDVTDAVANAIKIRANGEVQFVSSEDPVNGIGGAFSIRGSDAVGDYAALDNCTPSTCSVLETQDVDTTYDGQWLFGFVPPMSNGTPATDFWLADADADSTLDPVSPGNATGSSADITFQVYAYDSNGNSQGVLFEPKYPSGQYDAQRTMCRLRRVPGRAEPAVRRVVLGERAHAQQHLAGNSERGRPRTMQCWARARCGLGERSRHTRAHVSRTRRPAPVQHSRHERFTDRVLDVRSRCAGDRAAVAAPARTERWLWRTWRAHRVGGPGAGRDAA